MRPASSRTSLTSRQPLAATDTGMIDAFAIGLTHLLLAIAAWRLVWRPDLDRDPQPQELQDPATPDDSAAPKGRARRNARPRRA